MITIRPAEHGEADALASLGLRAWAEGIGPHVPDHVRRRICASNPFLPFILEMGPHLLVAERDGTAIGIAGCERHSGELSDLWVDPVYFGRGVGSALLDTVTRRAAAEGHERLSLQVMTDNRRALEFYLSRGFDISWQAELLDGILGIPLHKTGMDKKLTSSM